MCGVLFFTLIGGAASNPAPSMNKTKHNKLIFYKIVNKTPDSIASPPPPPPPPFFSTCATISRPPTQQHVLRRLHGRYLLQLPTYTTISHHPNDTCSADSMTAILSLLDPKISSSKPSSAAILNHTLISSFTYLQFHISLPRK